MAPKKVLIKVIPEFGEVNLDRITSVGGHCNRGACNNKFYVKLKDHFKRVHFNRKRPLKQIGTLTAIPSDGEVNVNDLVTGPGRCEREGCKKEFAHLKGHFQAVHTPHPRVVKLTGFLKVVPADGEVNPDHLTSNGGHCNRGSCNNKHYTQLKKHFKTVHVPRSSVGKLLGFLKVIPATGDVDPDHITSRKGYCGRKGCKREYAALKEHFKSVHIPRPRGVKLPSLLKVVPATGDVNPDHLTTQKGYCGREGCEQEFACLKAHFQNVHVPRPRAVKLPGSLKVIPATGDFDPDELTTRKGYCGREGCEREFACLKEHFERAHVPRPPVEKLTGFLKVVPAEGDVNPDHLTTRGGNCDRGSCNNKFYAHLRRHYQDVHTHHPRLIRQKGTISDIQEEGEVDVEEIVSGQGTCSRGDCDNATFVHLYDHYLNVHVNPRRVIIKVIPADGNVNLDDIYTHYGRCDMPGCKTDCANLKRHYINVHRRELKLCPICQKSFIGCSFVAHLRVHSGPSKCSVKGCGAESTSLNGMDYHIYRHHQGDSTAKGILMTEDEAEDFNRRKQLISDNARPRPLNRIPITCLAKKLDEYEIELHDPSSYLHQMAERAKKELHTYFEVPTPAVLPCNASFASIWQVRWMIPSLVVEVVDRRELPEFYDSKSFYADPKVGADAQPNRNDYAFSGFVRGHLASAANFDEVSMVLPTYYYVNIVPMTPALNTNARASLERFIRERAQHRGNYVVAAHFPIMKGPAVTIGGGVRVPSSIGTVLIEEKGSVRKISAWDLPNLEDGYDFTQCRRDPFELLKEAQRQFKLAREDFGSISTNYQH